MYEGIWRGNDDYGYTYYFFSKDITDSSVSDLSISFNYVQIHWYDILFEEPTKYYILVSLVFFIGVSIVWLVLRRRRKLIE